MPQHTSTFDLPELTSDQILAISLDALKDLDWTVKYGAGSVIVAFTKRSWKSYGEQITLSASEGRLQIESKMVHAQAADLFKMNKKHIEKFKVAFDNARRNFRPERMDSFKAEMQTLTDSTVKEAEAEALRMQNIEKVMNLSKGNMNLTYGIMGVNVLIFAIMALSGVSMFAPLVVDLLTWGANYRGLTLYGESWRLFTSMFLHIGILHLLLNMYALYIAGYYLERMLGKLRFGVAYVCTGLIGSMASVAMNDVVSAGASGAIFGMYGVFLALLTTKLIDPSMRKGLLQSIGIFVVYNLIYGFKPNSGVDNAAHLGGFVSGFIIGYVYLASLRKPEDEKLKTRLLIMVALATMLALYFAIENLK
jgi:rhomboid protease GluP